LTVFRSLSPRSPSIAFLVFDPRKIHALKAVTYSHLVIFQNLQQLYRINPLNLKTPHCH